ncbi:MAG: hypothetical protein RLZ98_114 [Pseudomonadota bacterium]|jgi:hypothetical protein
MKLSLGLCAVAVAMMAAPISASAQSGDGVAHPRSDYYRGKGPQVRSYVVRRGGYSYSIEDTYNTYGDARTRYGSNSFYRDPFVDRQTNFGPFDHGFFFDSGVGPRGGDAPQY